MFREIRRSERITDRFENKKDENNFLKIEPECGMTVKEANAFWDSIFEEEEL